MQCVSALVPSGIAVAQLLQEASQERTQPVSLALSFLVVWAASGATAREGNGAESVLQGFRCVFAQCKSLCNIPGASQPGLVVLLPEGNMPGYTFPPLPVGRRWKSALLELFSQVTFPLCRWELM